MGVVVSWRSILFQLFVSYFLLRASWLFFTSLCLIGLWSFLWLFSALVVLRYQLIFYFCSFICIFSVWVCSDLRSYLNWIDKPVWSLIWVCVPFLSSGFANLPCRFAIKVKACFLSTPMLSNALLGECHGLCSFFCLQMVPTCRRFLHKSSFPWTYLLSDSCSFSFLHCLCCFMGCLPRAFLSLDWPRCSCKDCSPIRFHFQLQSNSVRCDLTLLFYWLGDRIDHHSITDCSCPKS